MMTNFVILVAIFFKLLVVLFFKTRIYWFDVPLNIGM